MASRFRSLYDPAAQNALDQVPTAPEPTVDVARAQTLARSSSNPQAQRAGYRMLDEAARQQDQALRQQERDARKADYEARRAQAEQAKQAAADQARSVREAAAQGAKIETDVATGKRTVATHSDGAVKFETGPVGQPVIQQTAEAAMSSIPGMGGFMSLARPADQQSLSQTQEVAQAYRDDRGNTVTQPLPTKTDPKTGAITSTVKDPVTGRPTAVPLGTDQAIQAKAAKDAELEQRRQEIALRKNRVDQDKMRFTPQWEPVKREFDEAGKDLNAFNEKQAFMRDPATGKMAKRDPSTGLPAKDKFGQPLAYDPNELAKWQNDQKELQSRHERAKAAHDKLAPFAENLNRNETEIKDARLKLVEEKIRFDSGLPDDDGGASTILAQASGEVEKPAAKQAVDEHVFPMVYAPEVLDAAEAAKPASKSNRYPVGEAVGADLEYFRKNPGVTGMAIGAGLNESPTDAPRSVVLNPFSKNPDGTPMNEQQKQAVVMNESIRHFMDETKPKLNFEPTQAQKDFFKGEEYGKPENIERLKETIVARILTGDESAGKVTPEQEAAAKAIMTQFNAASTAKPLVPTDSPDKAKVFAEAFGGLVAADKLALGDSGEGFQFIKRNGANIGAVEQDKHGNTFVTMGENLNGTEDLRQSVAFGTTSGIPVYLHDTTAAQRDTVKEAQYVASVFDAMKDPIISQDRTIGAARLAMLDATPAAIARKVSTGEMSIQHGEAIMKGVYGATLKADDPLDGKTFGTWISGADQEVKDKYTAAAKAKDTAALNAIKNDYLSEWYVANRGKPGVNFKTREIAAAALTGKLRTGESAAALGGGLMEAGGSMIGMLSAPGMLGYLAVNELANGSDADSRKAMDDTFQNYGRASKNTWRGWNLSRQKWFTPEGKANLSAFESAKMALGATIRSQDAYVQGFEDPKWKQEYKARVDAVTDAAYAMHAMNLEEGWEVTRDDLDPSKNPALAKMVNGYAMTGDKSLLDGYFSALMEDHGTRQAQGYLADLTMGRGKFMSALISGANAPPEEIGVEIASTILTAGIGKAVFGGAKTAKLMETGTEAITSASRMTKFRLGALGLKNEFMQAGMVADTLANPASKLGKASNFIVKGAKVSAANAASEGIEEAAMAISDRNANTQSIASDAAMGALAGFFMGPVMAAPSILAQSSRQTFDQTQAAKTFADAYNTANRGAEGFAPVTVEQAKTAMALAPDEVRVKLIEASKAATSNLIAAVEAAKNSKDPAVLNALSRAQAVSLITHDALATDAAKRTEAVIAIQNTDPANKDFAMALAKVASGRTDLLTGAERQAAGARQTRDGKPYFATVQKFTPEGEAVTVDVVTDDGRAEAMQDFPQVAALIQTTESQAIFEAATTPPSNEQDPQGTPRPQGTPPNPQPAPADANAPLPAGGNGTPAPVSGGTGAASAQASVNLAELEAGEYEAARSIDPTMPDAVTAVIDAINAGRPVSVSLLARGNFIGTPEGYTRQGALFVRESANEDLGQNESEAESKGKVGRAGTAGPSSDLEQSSGADAAIPDGGASSNPKGADGGTSGAARSAIERAKARFPGLTGGFQIVEGGDGTTGGAQASGATITILTGDLERELSGYTPEKQDSRVDAVIDEEVIHLAQFEAARRSGESVEDFYGALWGEFTPAQRKAAASTYQATFDKQEDWQKAAETVRILIQQRADGRVTELTKAFNKNIPARLVEILKAAVEFLKSSIENGEISQRVQDAITGIEAILAEYSTDKTTDKKQAATPVNQATARETQDKTTDTATTEESSIVDPAQDLRDATETIRQAVVAAIASNPALKGTDLGFDLEDIAFDMAEALATVPAQQRKGMVDAAIAAWLEDNIDTKPVKDTGTADQKARRKAWRQVAQAKLTAAARAILNSGVHEAFSAVFDKGRITPMPNILGLIRKRRADGKVLTQKEIDVWQNESEWNGALKKSDYTGGGQNPLARAMIDLIMARQGEGQSPNTMADALKRVGTGKLKDMDSASDLWEQLAKELRAVTSGKNEDKAGFDPMDDPNYEPTDAEIAAWEAKQAATQQDQDQQPYVTLQDAHTYAIESFGPDAPITQKIGTVSEHADRFYRDDMPAVRSVISAEFARHASGQAIVEASKPEFEGPAASFYRFFITTPAQKMRETLASLPVVDVDSALFSSPTQPGFSFDQTTDAGDKSQKGFNFDTLPPGPNAKFVENTQKAYDNATTNKARENIAKDSAAREGMKRGKVQNVPQGMMDFGISGSFGTKDQPGLFSSPTALPPTTQKSRTIADPAPVGADLTADSGTSPVSFAKAFQSAPSKPGDVSPRGDGRSVTPVARNGAREIYEKAKNKVLYAEKELREAEESSREQRKEWEKKHGSVGDLSEITGYGFKGGSARNFGGGLLREMLEGIKRKRQFPDFADYLLADKKQITKVIQDGDVLAENKDYDHAPFPEPSDLIAARESLAQAEANLYLAEEEFDPETDARLADAEKIRQRELSKQAAMFAALLDARDEEAKNAARSFVAKVWNAYGNYDEVFQFGKSTSKKADKIAEAVSSPSRLITATDAGDSVRFASNNGHLTIMDADTARPHIAASSAGSKDKKGGGGSQLYVAALDWIHNNGKRIKDDPGGLTDINAIRRTSNFFDSAIRHGTTAHLKPHAKQNVGKWTKNDVLNTSLLATKEMENAFKAIPEARSWTFAFSTGTFWKADGSPVTESDFEAAVAAGKPGNSGIGLSTLQRAVITASAIQDFQRGTASSALESAESGPTDSLTGILYSSPSNQRSLDFGTTGSFNTRNQPGFDFGTSQNTRDSLAGAKIDAEWSAFAPQSGTLGIPRAEMPQVKAADRSALVQYLRARGVDYQTEEVLPGTLKPTQAEYSPAKVRKAREFAGETNRSILVSGDNYVLDGHHQWMAKVADSPKEPMAIIRLNAPIAELLPMVREMPSSFTAAGSEEASTPPAAPKQPTRPRSAVQNLWDWASDASASIDPRAPQGNLFDTTPKTTDTQSNDIPSSTNLEPDRQQPNTGNGSGQGGVSTRPGSTRQARRPLDEGGSRSGNTGQGGSMPASMPTATDGITGDSSVPAAESPTEGSAAGNPEPSGRRGPDDGGLSPERPGPSEPRINLVLTPESTGPLAPSRPRSTQGGVTSEWESPLTPEQQGDVEFIDSRLNQNGHPGVLLTNGTGTGKTFSGLGAIKQALDRGAMHILVVAPSDKVGSDWKNTAQEFFDIQDAAQLVDTKDNGGTNRLVFATYANLEQNNSLVNRPWDMVVADEAHYLSQNKEGKDTNALDTFRALTFHKNGIYRRAEMLEPEAAEISKQIRKLPARERLSPIRTAQMEQADRALSAARERVRSQMPAREARPKAILLSATPFAWHFSLDYAEGYLFDHGPEPTSTAYNTPSARDRFYIENFGYRMRTGRLTQPDAAAATATGILERRFAEKLMKEKAMSGRALQVDQDYSRQFVLSETKLGEQIDVIIKAIRENPRFTVLSDYIGLGDYLARRYLLEGMKARESVDRIRKHLAMGRKVVVFHDYKKGGAVNPLRAVFHKGDVIEKWTPEGMERINLPMRLAELKRAIPEYEATERELDGLLSPIDRIEREFPQARIFNGSVPKGQRRAIIDEFNRSGGPVNLILVQRASGKEGISLHDRDAKHQRVFIDIGLANRPTDAIQGEGRIYRHGVRSNAIVEYLSTGTDFERQTFAETIAKRSSTAENLAMGERARSLLQSFATGYNEAEAFEPNENQGTGGKAMDRQIEEGSSYKTAVALFYTNQKKTSRNKSSEGTDYFATPEPLGFKMVEWADIQPGEKVLEPSAGHGAIARFFPDSTNRHGIEPSSELASRLALNATDITIHRQRFEDYNVMNKFNAVVMNPPFGTAGKTAMEHLEKAVKHLRIGGRVVALIPEGSSMEKRFNKWYNEQGRIDGKLDPAGVVYISADIKLPAITFSRAGTNVSTRVVILTKFKTPSDASFQSGVSRDLSRFETMEEFLKELEFITVPPRPEPIGYAVTEETEAEQTPNIITGGRDFILPTSIPQPEATFSTAEFNHSKTGVPLFVAKIERRLSKDEYARVAASAKAFGGYYSSYKKDGAIPGFHFKSAEARDVFIGGASGESSLGSSPTLYSSPAPQQPDLFTAATAPDATQKLGTVRVGTMNALGAYRALTAKRDAGKALTGEEEEKLLQAEQALGQKLAFDMDALKNPEPEPAVPEEESVIVIKTKPDQTNGGPVMDFINAIQKEKGTFRTEQLYQFGNVIVRLFDGSNKWMGMDFYRKVNLKGSDNTYTVTRVSSTGKRSERGYVQLNIGQESPPAKPAAQVQKTTQQSMFMGPETTKDGQMSLFSSPTPAQDAEYLAAVESGDMETAQRMVDEAGRNRKGVTEAVHGGVEGITSFDAEKIKTQDGGAGFYFSTDVHSGHAENYAKNLENGKVYRVFLTHKNPYSSPTAYTNTPSNDKTVWKPTLESIRSLYGLTDKEMKIFVDHFDGLTLNILANPWEFTYRLGRLEDRDVFSRFSPKAQSGIITMRKTLSGDYGTQNKLDLIGFLTKHDGIIYREGSVATVLHPSQIKSADPVTRDADGNVIPLSKRFNPASDSILFSSPTLESIDWKKFPPVFKVVYAAILEGQSVAQIAKKLRITEKAVTNISTQLSTRVQALDEASDGKLVPKMRDGLLERGRPERAMSVSSPEVARILQIRQDNADPEVVANAETYDRAKRMIAADYQGTIERITNRRANGEDLTLDEVAAAQMILLGKVGKKRSQMTPEEKVQLGWLAMDWVEQGTDDARRLQIRRDVTNSPAERAALYFAKELYTPQDKATVEALKNAKGRKAKEAVMKRFIERSEGLKARLKERGIDLEASLEEFRRQQDEKQAMEEAVKQAHDRLTNGYQDEVNSLQDQLAKANEATAAAQAAGSASEAQIAKMQVEAAAMAEKLKKARADLSKARMLEPGLVLRTALLNLTDAQKAAMETLLNGGTIENALAVGGMTQEELKKLYTNFGSVLKKARLEAQALAKQRMLEMPPVLMSSSMESDELRMVGYVPWGELEERKAPITPEQVKVKPKKQPKAKPAEPVTLTPEQQEAIDAAFEEFKAADPSTWSAWWQETSTKLTPMIGQTSFEQFKERVMQPWKDRWQAEMEGIANPSARITFEEWIAKPSTRETAKRERDLFPQPINETTGTFDTTVPNREGSLFPQPINEITGTWNDTRPYTSQGELIREEISTTTGLLDFNDIMARKRLWEEFEGMNATMSDKVFEFWKASILSGPQTAVRNLISNVGFGGFKMIPRRALEAAVNSSLKMVGLGSNEAATFGEFAVMAKHLRKAAHLASRTMFQSWQLESPVFEYYALGLEQQIGFNGSKGEPIAPALKGKLRKVMHGISFRHMLASDEFAKAYFGQLEAAAQAHRITKAEGLTGTAYEARMDELLENRGSEAWKRAFAEMQINTFQEKLRPEGVQSIHRFDQAADFIMKMRNAPYLGKPLNLILPFVLTPTNIAKQAMIHSPIGGILAVADATRALHRKLSAGKLDARGMRISKEEANQAAAELYDKARFVRDLTNQTIAFGVYFMIAQMLEPDDDDDLPWITGTTSYKAANRGERDTENRVMPALSIRLPGMGNSYYSYSGLDPLASLISGTVDVANDVRRTGGMDTEVMGRFFVHVRNAMADKTYLKGLSDLAKAWDSPDRFIPRLAGNIATGFVPNLIRQPVREMDNVQRDIYPREGDGVALAMAKRVGFSVVPQAAPPKLDIWGNPLPANQGIEIGGAVTDAMIRIIDPGNITIGAKIDPIDRYIFNWNNSAADDRDKIQITPLDGFITAKIDGKQQRIPLSVEEQQQAIINVGTVARRVLGEEWDYKNPTDAGARRIIETFRDLKEMERARLRNEKLAAMPATQ